MNLQIQCPKCSKRFTIHEDLSGKTVECGSCDHRFPVKPESIIAEKPRVYPGEQKSDDFFNRLGRQPRQGGSGPEPAVGSATMVPKVDAIMPASPARNIAVGVGITILILYGLIFLGATGKSGAFQDVAMIKRIFLSSFVSVLGVAMVIYGAKTWRFQATMLALGLVAALAALTAMRPVYVTPDVNDAVIPITPQAAPEERELDDSAIKQKVGYGAVERKLKEMEERFGPAAANHLVAIFIEDLEPGQFFNVERYFKRVFNIPPDEAINRYKRNGDQDSLIVVSGLEIDFDEAVRFCDPRLGRARTFPELRLIDLKLSAIHSSEVSDDLLAALKNPGNRSFFSMNLKELGALDPERAKNAVRNLSNVPPDIELQYQEEIVTELMQLLGGENDGEMLTDLARAFRRWAPENPAARVVVSRKVGRWLEAGTEVDPDFINYLIESKEPKSLAYIDELWSKEPELWTKQYILIGPMAEPRLIEHLDGPRPRLRKSAASILGETGTDLALPTLEKYRNTSDEELKIIVERAIKEIKSR